jgi:hypothetical protein
MKRDQVLVTLFLKEYEEISGEPFVVKEWVDDTERNKPAIEAIAVNDSTGKSLAIEHTLLQPFEGEKEDSHRFLTVIGDLEKDDSIKLPKYMIGISLQVGAIPKGVDWNNVNKSFGKWIGENVAGFPDGQSKSTFRHDDLDIELGISKMTLERDENGKVLFSRAVPPNSLPDVMRTAFKRKLPKLVGTLADKRILLLEQNSLLQGSNEIHEVVGKIAAEYPDLKKVDEIWLVGTVGWESDDYLYYAKIWPDIATWIDGELQ